MTKKQPSNSTTTGCDYSLTFAYTNSFHFAFSFVQSPNSLLSCLQFDSYKALPPHQCLIRTARICTSKSGATKVKFSHDPLIANTTMNCTTSTFFNHCKKKIVLETRSCFCAKDSTGTVAFTWCFSHAWLPIRSRTQHRQNKQFWPCTDTASDDSRSPIIFDLLGRGAKPVDFTAWPIGWSSVNANSDLIDGWFGLDLFYFFNLNTQPDPASIDGRQINLNSNTQYHMQLIFWRRKLEVGPKRKKREVYKRGQRTIIRVRYDWRISAWFSLIRVAHPKKRSCCPPVHQLNHQCLGTLPILIIMLIWMTLLLKLYLLQLVFVEKKFTDTEKGENTQTCLVSRVASLLLRHVCTQIFNPMANFLEHALKSVFWFCSPYKNLLIINLTP